MSNSARAIEVGSVIADTYTIEALIGRGGMGSVYVATHNRLPGKRVAIKLLHAEFAEGEEVLARFKREAEIATRLGHPNIVEVHDFNVTSAGTPYLILEYLQGESLAARMQHGPMSLDQVLPIVRQVGSALAAAHRADIVHRDLKPQNIFLVSTEVDGRSVEIAKVLDFGISKIRGSQTVKTQESMLLGTPQYMAPEQAKGEHASVDERTDVFAFGSIVYEMLCGQPAFSGASIPEVVFKVVYEQPAPLAERLPGLSAAHAAAIACAMSKLPAERFPTVGAFVEAFTGQMISVIRPPSRKQPESIAPPTGSKIRDSASAAREPEAFAATMGSGDHGKSSVASAPHPITQRPIVSAQAQTVMSDGAIAIPPKPPRPRALIAGLALAGLAGVTLLVYFLVRSGDEPRVAIAIDAARAADPVVATAPADAAPTKVSVDATIAKTPIDAAVVAKAPIDAAQRPSAGGNTASRDGAPDTAGGAATDELGQNIAQAETAFKAGDWDTAEKMATLVLNARNAKPLLTAQAHSIRGAIRCAKYNNAERARDDLRAIARGFVGQRARLIRVCREHGFLEEDQ